MTSTIKTSELSGSALDWAVAKCEGNWVLCPSSFSPHHRLGRMNFTKDWAQGGPIIEREGIGFFCNRTAEIGARFKPDAGADWRAFALNKHGEHYYAHTPLIAAMRCYVASKLGDTVNVPEELA